MDNICTWIYLDSPDESSEYPQVGAKSHLLSFQKVYWKCVAVFFACSTKTNPNRRHILFSNQKLEDFPDLDGFDLRKFLQERNVEVITLPLTFQTPKGYFGRFRNQFYIFDITRYFEKNFGEGAFVVLDSDCIIQKSLDGMFDKLHESGLMVLPMGFDANYEIHGITRRQMRQIFEKLDGGSAAAATNVVEVLNLDDVGKNSLPEYFGGEIFAATLPTIRKINSMVPRVWQEMLRRHSEGEMKLNEEAHFLSYFYRTLGEFPVLNGFIKRIWTSPKFTNVAAADAELSIWHLPSEKTGGIALLFERLKNGDLPAVSEWGGFLGVPRRTRFLDFKHFFKYSFVYRFWLKFGGGN